MATWEWSVHSMPKFPKFCFPKKLEVQFFWQGMGLITESSKNVYAVLQFRARRALCTWKKKIDERCSNKILSWTRLYEHLIHLCCNVYCDGRISIIRRKMKTSRQWLNYTSERFRHLVQSKVERNECMWGVKMRHIGTALWFKSG